MDREFFRNQLWTAPELLRMTTRPINGTQKADVYSFAIILQEIMFRAEPYFIDIDPPQRIIFSFCFYDILILYDIACGSLCVTSIKSLVKFCNPYVYLSVRIFVPSFFFFAY